MSWYDNHDYRQVSNIRRIIVGNKICRLLRCSSWSIACRRCSNYIFILDLTPGFIGLGKDNCKTRREVFKFGDFGASYIRGFTVLLTMLTRMAIPFCPWTFFWTVILSMLPSNSFMSNLYSQLGYSTGEFQALRLIVLGAWCRVLITRLLYVSLVFGNRVLNNKSVCTFDTAENALSTLLFNVFDSVYTYIKSSIFS